MSKISISIEYAGLQLQIGKNEQGQDVTPLKPIADLFGLKWETQRKKSYRKPIFKQISRGLHPPFGGCRWSKKGANLHTFVTCRCFFDEYQSRIGTCKRKRNRR